MTIHFLDDLDRLTKELLAMGRLVEENIAKSLTALISRRSELVNQVVEGDHVIDGYETAIEEACLQILARHQPVAQDLRLILTVMKVNNELERMGDHAKNLAKTADFLCAHDPLPIYRDLEAMGRAGMSMVADSLRSLIDRDRDLAQSVRDRDDAVDDGNVQVMTQVAESMRQDPELVYCGMQVVRAARNLERIADIATNIAKDVVFLVDGAIVRHTNEVPSGDPGQRP